MVLAFFCQGSFAQVATGFRKAVEGWLQEIPTAQLKWVLSGASASELKPIGPATISRCVSKLKSTTPPKGELTMFTLQGPEEDNPAFRVDLLVHHAATRTSSGTLNSSYIECRFPTEYVEEKGTETVFKLALEMAADVPFNSGYLSPAVSWSYESDLHLARKIIGPLGLRHPGLDISFNASSSYKIDKKTRGPYWVTFLGPPLLESLGSEDELKDLKRPIAVHRLANGVAVRAGDEPHVGDVNRNDKPTELRAVAELLEPITFFEDKAIETYLFGDNADTFQRWDRRLLD